jgi:hypothetical protein
MAVRFNISKNLFLTQGQSETNTEFSIAAVNLMQVTKNKHPVSSHWSIS